MSFHRGRRKACIIGRTEEGYCRVGAVMTWQCCSVRCKSSSLGARLLAQPPSLSLRSPCPWHMSCGCTFYVVHLTTLSPSSYKKTQETLSQGVDRRPRRPCPPWALPSAEAWGYEVRLPGPNTSALRPGPSRWDFRVFRSIGGSGVQEACRSGQMHSPQVLLSTCRCGHTSPRLRLVHKPASTGCLFAIPFLTVSMGVPMPTKVTVLGVGVGYGSC